MSYSLARKFEIFSMKIFFSDRTFFGKFQMVKRRAWWDYASPFSTVLTEHILLAAIWMASFLVSLSPSLHFSKHWFLISINIQKSFSKTDHPSDCHHWYETICISIHFWYSLAISVNSFDDFLSSLNGRFPQLEFIHLIMTFFLCIAHAFPLITHLTVLNNHIPHDIQPTQLIRSLLLLNSIIWLL